MALRKMMAAHEADEEALFREFYWLVDELLHAAFGGAPSAAGDPFRLASLLFVVLFQHPSFHHLPRLAAAADMGPGAKQAALWLKAHVRRYVAVCLSFLDHFPESRDELHSMRIALPELWQEASSS